MATLSNKKFLAAAMFSVVGGARMMESTVIVKGRQTNIATMDKKATKRREHHSIPDPLCIVQL